MEQRGIGNNENQVFLKPFLAICDQWVMPSVRYDRNELETKAETPTKPAGLGEARVSTYG